MNFNNLLFVIFPYLSLAVVIAVSIYRSVYRPFSISSLSSQLLENRKLFWGSISFHYGIVAVLLGHLVALLLPQSLLLWNAMPIRLYLLEITGLALGIWATIGMLVLVWRRLSERKVWAVTSPMDLVVLVLLLLSGVTGVLTATVYRFGSYWFTGIFTPYLLSILTLQPRPELVAMLPWLVKLHVINFFVLLIVFPFSRLVHIITYPLGYLVRPWQIVISGRRAMRAPREPRNPSKRQTHGSI